MEVFLPILNFLLPVIATILTIVLAALAKKYLGKLGVERSEKIDAMIDDYVGKGVKAAERMGTTYLATKGQPVGGENKKAHAVNVVLAELEQSGLKGVGEELIKARIEAFLEDKEPGKSTGAPDSTSA